MLRHVQERSGATVAVVRFDERAERLSFESLVTLDHVPQTAFELEGAAAPPSAWTPSPMIPRRRPTSAWAMVRQHADAGEVEAWARRFVRPGGRTRLSTLLSDTTHGLRGELTLRQRPGRRARRRHRRKPWRGATEAAATSPS